MQCLILICWKNGHIRVRENDVLQLSNASVMAGADDHVLVRKRNPVIGDDGRRKDGVRPAAFRAPETADPQREGPFRQKDASFVIRMDRETGGVPAGTGKAVELQMVNNGIVINL